jgi:hypothetical protein
MGINSDYILVMRQYIELNETVLEGFQYVVNNSENSNQHLINQVFNDSLLGIDQLYQTTEILCNEFAENITMVSRFGKFNSIIQFLLEYEDDLTKQEERNVLLRNQFIPMYQEWIQEVGDLVSVYIDH